ncbi:MAG TPA: arylsulfatase [Bryobacteraceae bacterium]|nr:arylsulfatase [Bryobacteraceae bacterium]
MQTTRRDALKLAASLSAASLSAQPSQKSQPHILLLMADQFRGDCLGADGNRVIRTPNLDRIAAEGARFSHAYSSTPTCTPARSALLTGLSPWNHGMLQMIAMAIRYPFEKPRAMRDAGYNTAVIGKNHYHLQRNAHGYEEMLVDESGRVESPEFRSDYRSWFWSMAPNLDPDATGLGWNDYRGRPYALPERLHPTAWIGETAVRFIESYTRPQPMFLKVSWERPHSPYDPPERFWRIYQNANLPPAHVGKWAAKYAPRSGSDNDIWHGDVGAAEIRTSRQGYYGSISFVDEQIGRILEALEKRHLLDETLILFLSDHGDMTGDQNLWRKSYAYEPSARIPMLVRWPTGLLSASRGQVLSQPVEIRDVLPTFLDAAGVSEYPKLDGKSLLSLIAGKTENWRPYIDLEHGVCYSPANHWNALTDGHEKYIYHAYDGSEQFFNLKRDPHELNDLASEPSAAPRVSEWRNRMIAHLAPRGDAYVKNGRLIPRPQNIPTSPNFPGNHAQSC